jgi:hypothetical protein
MEKIGFVTGFKVALGVYAAGLVITLVTGALGLGVLALLGISLGLGQ